MLLSEYSLRLGINRRCTGEIDTRSNFLEILTPAIAAGTNAFVEQQVVGLRESGVEAGRSRLAGTINGNARVFVGHNERGGE